MIMAFLMAGTAAFAAPAPAKFPIKVKISIKGAESGDTFVIVPQKKYSLSLSGPERNRSKIALYDKNGNKKQGLYWIQNKDLEKIMRKPIADILRVAQNRPAPRPACADCATDDAQDNEPTPEPVNEPVVQTPVADLPATEGEDALCGMYRNFRRKGVPKNPLKQAMSYFSRNRRNFSNDKVISIADYSAKSSAKRFYLLNLRTGEVTNEKVSHGSGRVGGGNMSDPNNDGVVDRCEHPGRVKLAARNPRGNYKTRENMTRPGFFKASELSFSASHARKWPRITRGTNSLRLDGLSGRVNAGARGDGVLMHEAYYNHTGPSLMGRSWGCPAFVPGRGAPIMKAITGGSLYYSYVPVCQGDMAHVLRDVPDWENFCGAD